ncbi:MAG: cytotoxic translational repressor of toxin-antitoxin stability system [Trichodesmium sp. St16_bin4-tuft]|nr:cytotoxic translational repressor of toxin-antitoxin stability system [Trichodesmium sp. MAG_R01]MDE5068959.1 cytotoxic translational repressor of toxin-antitoxin stability system [Trichodesmium sp. St4_bin8_1]MDE5071832.1 cytotoxic translational repressor of toxin-antitoxin stability system [Trichodesmium sp. St5_bin8]MDE5078864.1 cytotoxic translational repressor of toxin-antitoxin stability system [Trichodesmium sp. St2_bin6]MDE5090811.1 cytotoxic translational repressor of toxin-antitoxi
MNLEVRYCRSFIEDLKMIESSAYQQVYDFVFIQFSKINYLQELPELKQIGTSNIFYRFTVENYLIGIEVTGKIVKFIRILPKPEI